MDALSAVLKALQLESIVCQQLVLRGSWGLDITQHTSAQFWRVVAGSCVLGLAEGPPLALSPGDIVFIPHQARHWLAAHPGSPRVPLSTYVAAFAAEKPLFREAGAEVQLIGGHFRFDQHAAHPLLHSLPAVIHLPGFGTSHQHPLAHTSHLILSELTTARPGSELMLQNLAEMLLVSIIRAYLEQAGPAARFLAALHDPAISRVLRLVHEAPAHPWTVTSLARSGAMSRSVFAGRFKQLVGETPLTYLTNWRIGQAKHLLATEKTSVGEVAARVGYQSEAAFNRLFKRKTGHTPAGYRRHRLGG